MLECCRGFRCCIGIGVQFYQVEDAVKDPFYKNDLDLTLSPVPDSLEEAMWVGSSGASAAEAKYGFEYRLPVDDEA
jgi:hypothetical protein